MTRLTPVAAAFAGFVLSCQEPPTQQGAAGASMGGGGGASAVPLPCEDRTLASRAPLRVLIRGEYERTLRATFGDSAVESALTNLVQVSDQKPPHGFRSMSLGTTGGDVEARFQVSDQVAKHVAQDPAPLAALAPCAATAPLTETCATELLPRLGLHLFRRPLDPDEQAWLSGVYQEGRAITATDGLRFAIFALLQSPNFLYRVETRGTPLASDSTTLALSPYELASRLSFLVWGVAPDAALLQSAAAGTLDSQAGLASELERLLTDARARGQLTRFFQQWLEVEQLPIVNQTGPFLGEISGEGLADAMQRELTQTLLGLTFDDRAPFSRLYTADVAFVDSPELAKLYGVAAPASGGRTTLDPQRRAGLLTRAALLLTSGETTSPIRRGAFVKRKLLCDEIPPPDPNALPPGALEPPAFDQDATSRQRWSLKTSEPQCAVCHGQFNDLGFALENYDAIGRYRETEPIIDPKSGVTLQSLPIDASIEVTLDELAVQVSGAVELGRALAESQHAQQCFAAQWLRFGAGRLEEESDACVLRDVASSLNQGLPLLDALERVVLAPEFRLRKLEAP